MLVRQRFPFAMLATLLSGYLGAGTAHAAKPPTVTAALRLRPVQNGVGYDIPDATTRQQCIVEAAAVGRSKGWAVRHPAGYLLRRFLDTNGDNVVDTWSYYREGLEVYRDLDGNFNGKADQYRWLSLEGSRWALDSNEDGVIDRWRSISAEEAAAEAVAAMSKNDFAALQRVMVSASDAATLGIRADSSLLEIPGAAQSQFQKVIAENKSAISKMRWMRFDGSMPSLVPGDTIGSREDVMVYQNVLAMVEIGDDTAIVYVGEMVRVGDTWKLVDIPQLQLGEQIQLSQNGRWLRSPLLDAGSTPITGPGITREMAELLGKLQALDEETSGQDQPAEGNRDQRADLLEAIAAAAPEAQQDQWLRQLADELSAAAQLSSSGRAMQRLQALLARLQRQKAPGNLIAYAHYRQMTAAYAQALQAPKANLQEVQAQWLKQLEGFVDRYPNADDTPEAMLQLAVLHEFAGDEKRARRWYAKLAEQFPESPQGRKAAGALKRLDLVGKALQLRGRGLDRRPIATDDFRGKLLLVNFWASWSEASRADVQLLRDLYAKYRKQGFEIIGVNLDRSALDASEYVKREQIEWPQLFAPGGLNSRTASDLGIVSVPSMILVDEKGQVVDRAVQMADLEARLQSKLR